MTSWSYAPRGGGVANASGPAPLGEEAFGEEGFGEELGRHLVEVAIPKLQHAYTPTYLASAYDSDDDLDGGGTSNASGGRRWMRAILGEDEGDPQQATDSHAESRS